ncbi:melibiose carrier protein [Levilactobacillus zymae]|uniref:Melibiose carrier protein n=1 Tax=Levilactobacillus zymae TaxID=267363 RepID=A0ABQ0WV01_9LACO|nr:glycoside-pentoside-hexuronide (GPH):cation symporter [Levilactobacillus zymae]KRL07617.1 Na+ xyloside symporter related transporter [Levilactobacillus zymae DSM 19395]QFR62083.1 MFS transporter [Levilactobacillus zymae]GEO71551.1 melibiose carrier protein [Levilactobacillus zymae]
MDKTQKTITVSAAPFNIKDKIGYMFGDIGNNFSFNVVNSFLMIFYTNVLGLTGSQVGIIFLIARFVDAFADITVGRLVDNSKLHKIGRFKPWINRMRYPLLIALVLLFVPIVKDWALPMRLGWVFITYIAWGIFYSSVNIPYGSMASAISSDPNDKTSLSTFRSIGSAVGSAITSYIIPMFIYIGASQKISGSRFFWVVVACAILGYVCYELTTKLTTERVRTEKSEKVPLGRVVKGMFENKALIVLVLVDIMIVINQNLSGTLISYLFNDYFKNTSAMGIALIFNFATVILLAPFSNWMTRTFGRKECSIVALLIGAAIYGTLMVSHTSNMYFYLTMMFFGSLGAGVFNLMVWAFITDVIDNHEVLTGVREDGIVYGVNSFARKVAQAIAGGFGGFMLTFIGYKSSTGGGAVQSQAVIDKIYNLATGVPTVCLLVAALLLLFFYPLSKKRVNSNAAQLAKIHNANAEEEKKEQAEG